MSRTQLNSYPQKLILDFDESISDIRIKVGSSPFNDHLDYFLVRKSWSMTRLLINVSFIRCVVNHQNDGLFIVVHQKPHNEPSLRVQAVSVLTQNQIC